MSKETDLTLRTFLGARGAKKGDLSNSSRRLFAGGYFIAPFRTSGNATLMPTLTNCNDIIDDAMGEVRAERFAKRKKADKA